MTLKVSRICALITLFFCPASFSAPGDLLVAKYGCETADGGFPCMIFHFFNTLYRSHQVVYAKGTDDEGYLQNDVANHMQIINMTSIVNNQTTITILNQQEITLNVLSYDQQGCYGQCSQWPHLFLIPLPPGPGASGASGFM